LARSVTSDPIRINVGTTGQANEDITQIVQVFDQEEMKWDWLIRHLTGFCVGKLWTRADDLLINAN
jgi:ATP-dependent RNA helicase DDX42